LLTPTLLSGTYLVFPLWPYLFLLPSFCPLAYLLSLCNLWSLALSYVSCLIFCLLPYLLSLTLNFVSCLNFCLLFYFLWPALTLSAKCTLHISVGLFFDLNSGQLFNSCLFHLHLHNLYSMITTYVKTKFEDWLRSCLRRIFM
jgi:hypothetical protein